MIDVRGNDRASARDFVAHELGRDPIRNRGAEALPGMLARHELWQCPQRFLPLEILADGDELHLRRDDAAPRVVHLRYVASGLGTAWLAMQIEAHPAELGVGQPRAAVRRRELSHR